MAGSLLTTSWELAPTGQEINFPGVAGWLVGEIGYKANSDQLSRSLSWWWAEFGKHQFWKQFFCHPENIVTGPR